MTTKLTKVEKLAIAGAVAPTLRGEAPKRKIKVVGKDGKVVREIDDFELRKNILAAQEIEFSIDPTAQKVCAGPRPTIACPWAAPVPKSVSRSDDAWRCAKCSYEARLERLVERIAAGDLSDEDRNTLRGLGHCRFCPHCREEKLRQLLAKAPSTDAERAKRYRERKKAALAASRSIGVKDGES